jgi:DNA invertase Pin-like site-specific DNA recombinase
MGRALLYRRVSTDEQGLGLAAQRERLHDEADRRGWDAEEVTDEGVSGGGHR